MSGMSIPACGGQLAGAATGDKNGYCTVEMTPAQDSKQWFGGSLGGIQEPARRRHSEGTQGTRSVHGNVVFLSGKSIVMLCSYPEKHGNCVFSSE